MALSNLIGTLDGTSPLPKYQQLARAIERAIERGALPKGDALPPERDIAADMNVSRITVRKALDGLVENGLLDRKQGAGTFISGRVEKPFSRLSSFSEDMAGRGWAARSEWVTRSEGVITPEESLNLGLGPGTKVYRFTRIRYADDTPMAIETAIIPAFALPGLDAVKTSLYTALEGTGHRPVRALQRLRAVTFTPKQAKRLSVKDGDPGLFIERRGFLANGTTVEVTQSYYRGDAYDFVAELHA
ncbi:GntR family transcriptional regulator [Kordiimonas aestuarii]|uniref:GntR family transcriptional regulator n=1 Tax=Kordiimonas aestuarii TaxID=1005925 RepID=UPI0021D38195|nr:GntR family transcriptional regulator [Kordiimonas aestuarii]